MRRNVFLRVTGTLGAGLALGILDDCAPRAQSEDNVPDYQPSAEPAATFAPNAWVHVRPDGTVGMMLSKSEMGQGVYTGMAMLVAEELDVPLEQIRVSFAPAEDVYNDPQFHDMTTGGSTSTDVSAPIYRGAGAAARLMLVAAAAERWHVKPESCTTKDGVVHHPASGQSASYGDLSLAAAKQPVPAHVKLKDASSFRIIGTSPKRLDIDAKVNGTARYGIDVVLPDMVYANVVRPPTFGGSVKNVDDKKARAVAGVIDVVQISSGVAVVANNTWSAMQGRDALDVTWGDGPAAHINTPQLFAQAEKLARSSGTVAAAHGDVDRASGKKLEAVYRGPYLAHGAMEPMNATAHVRDDAADVWAPTQVQTRSKNIAIKVTGLPANVVNVHTTFLGGGFGRRLDADYVQDAVEISKAIKKPVKVTWSREDDVKNDFYRPMSVNVVRATVGDGGKIAAWEHRVASPSIVKRWAPVLLPKNGVDFSAVDEVTPQAYAFGSSRTVYADFEPGVPVGFMRAPGANWNTFVTESFIDELAHEAGQDPLAYRLANLAPSATRERGVLELVAEKGNWGHPVTPGASQGIALTTWDGSVAAIIAEVTVKGNTLRVHRAVVAANCGWLIHPDIVRAQLEGGLNYGLAMALSSKITLTDGKIDQSNFYDYTVLRMNQAPAIETHVVPSTNRPTGIGELSTPPIAPAVANAIFKATGKRVRQLPFSDTFQV